MCVCVCEEGGVGNRQFRFAKWEHDSKFIDEGAKTALKKPLEGKNIQWKEQRLGVSQI